VTLIASAGVHRRSRAASVAAMDDLPPIIPIFPLPNFVLFPGVKVPLHIFEPRYRAMVGDTAASDRIIGMALLRGDWQREYYGYADVFEVGCAGRIGELERLPDGKFNLILEGLCEFRMVNEMRDRPYRRARVQWRPVEREALELDDETIGALYGLLVSYVGDAVRQAWRSLVEERGLRGADLVNFLCFHLDLSPLEKQTLLEALDARIRYLFDVLTFKLEERKLGPGGSHGTGGIVQ
jgi:uncharacterized protein